MAVARAPIILMNRLGQFYNSPPSNPQWVDETSLSNFDVKCQNLTSDVKFWWPGSMPRLTPNVNIWGRTLNIDCRNEKNSHHIWHRASIFDSNPDVKNLTCFKFWRQRHQILCVTSNCSFNFDLQFQMWPTHASWFGGLLECDTVVFNFLAHDLQL